MPPSAGSKTGEETARDAQIGRLIAVLRQHLANLRAAAVRDAEIQSLIAELDDPATEPPRRREIGDLLDRLGDPRPGVGLLPNGLPDIAWVQIPAGPFIWQDGETRELPTFWISRYPVTNAQFQAFVDDGGYDGGDGLYSGAPRIPPGVPKIPTGVPKISGAVEVASAPWWRDLKQPKPASPRWPQGNRPRTDVDWYEAVAFTRWLNARLALPDDSIRLPTELEWEKAARGERWRIYPWGDDYRAGFANLDARSAGIQGRSWLRQTTAVGLYPHGRSLYGVEVLAGTVLEWCLNEYEDLDAVTPNAGGAARALRGGSWHDDRVNARADVRGRDPPSLRGEDWGFRVLSSVPIRAR